MEVNKNKEALELFLKYIGVKDVKEKLYMYDLYTELMLKWNKKFNITSILQKEEIFLKHFIDSLAVMGYINFNEGKIIDVGTGAGLPGVALKIAFSDINLTLVESTKKKINFLKLVTHELSLHDVQIISDRVENVGRDERFRGKYDYALSRAVANISVLTEYNLPLLKKGGHLISWDKGDINSQIEEGKKALQVLNGMVEKKESYGKWLKDKFRDILEEGDIDKGKYLVFIKKKKETPEQYPRRAGIPKKRPL